MTQRVLIALLLLPLIFSACTRRESGQEGKITITFWHSFVASTVPALQDLLGEFERTHPTLHIQAQYIPTGDGLIQKLVSAIQSGTAPDISWIHSDFLDKLVEADALVPMKEFLGGPDSLPVSDLRDLFPSLLEAGTFRNELYAMPMEATSLALLYNRGLFRNAGLDPDRPPRTWQELEDYASRLTSAPDDKGRRERYGFFVPVFPASGELNIWMILQWTPFLWQAGGNELTPDGAQVAFQSAAGVNALSLWKRIYRAEDFSKFGIAHDLGFASGKLAMVLDGPWNLPRYRTMTGVDWAVAPLPAGPSGRATYIAGEQLAIFRQSRHQAEAWTFVKWILGVETQARFSMKSGYLPVRRSVLSLPGYRAFLDQDPALKAFVEQMAVGRARRQIEHHRVEINRALAEAIERATLGGEDPAKCLDDAAAESNLLLSEHRETPRQK